MSDLVLTCVFISDAESEPQSLKADLEGTTEKSVPQQNIPPVDSKESKESPKQQNEENTGNQKKKVIMTVTDLHFNHIALY